MSWLTEPPNQFSPRESLVAYLRRAETHPGRDDSDLKREVADVRAMLAEKDRREVASAKTT
ncbi:MAG: hypothetical protein ABSC06_31550 [Rhodopila sp.]